MPSLSTISAISVAFLLGCFACVLPVLRESTTQGLVDLPHRSAMPTSGIGNAESAYAAIPHRRTPFDRRVAKMDSHHADYLQLVFDAIDEAIVIRVDALQGLLNGGSTQELAATAGHYAAYDELIDFVGQIPSPSGLRRYHELVVSAMTDQAAALREMHRQAVISQASSDEWMRLKTVQRSSAALQRAYQQLMSEFPDQPQSIINAFFDYHCALDFK